MGQHLKMRARVRYGVNAHLTSFYVDNAGVATRRVSEDCLLDCILESLQVVVYVWPERKVLGKLVGRKKKSHPHHARSIDRRQVFRLGLYCKRPGPRRVRVTGRLGLRIRNPSDSNVDVCHFRFRTRWAYRGVVPRPCAAVYEVPRWWPVRTNTGLAIWDEHLSEVRNLVSLHNKA